MGKAETVGQEKNEKLVLLYVLVCNIILVLPGLLPKFCSVCTKIISICQKFCVLCVMCVLYIVVKHINLKQTHAG